MNQNEIEGGWLTGIDKMAIELLSNSLVSGQEAKIVLPKHTYEAKQVLDDSLGFECYLTKIKKNGKPFCVVTYNEETREENIIFSFRPWC